MLSRQGEILDLKSKLLEISANLTISLAAHNFILAYESSERQRLLQTILEKRQELEMLEKLRPVLTARSSLEHSCLHGTRELPLEQIKAWAETMDAILKLFWVHGLAGSGKSSIAATICKVLKAKEALAGSFFCKRDVPEQRDPKRILPSLSFTLAQVHKPYRDYIMKILEKETDISTELISYQLTTLFLNPLSDLASQGNSQEQPLVFVVDALDECGDYAAVSQIADCLRQISNQVDWLKIFVTSRPSPAIVQKFSPSNSRHTQEIDLNTIDAHSDIIKYTTACLEELVDSNGLDRKWLEGNAIGTISQTADGLFLWVSTVARFIDGQYDKEDGMATILSGRHTAASSRLDSLYKTVIQSSRGSGGTNALLLKAVLGLISITAKNRPLSIAGLYDFMHAFGGRNRPTMATLGAIIDDLRSVLYEDHSKGNVIRVCHPSFLDYLENQERCGEYWTNPQQLNQIMFEKCSKLMQTTLRFNICELESSCIANGDIPDLQQRITERIPESLQYSCLYCFTHFTVINRPLVDGMIEKFFSSLYGLYWLEVLSLINGLKKGLDTLRSIADIYQVAYFIDDIRFNP